MPPAVWLRSKLLLACAALLLAQARASRPVRRKQGAKRPDLGSRMKALSFGSRPQPACLPSPPPPPPLPPVRLHANRRRSLPRPRPPGAVAASDRPWFDPELPAEQRVEALLAAMTTAQKVAQLQTDPLNGAEELGLFPFSWQGVCDHGVKLGNAGDALPAGRFGAGTVYAQNLNMVGCMGGLGVVGGGWWGGSLASECMG